jgi:hypothetical protein
MRYDRIAALTSFAILASSQQPVWADGAATDDVPPLQPAETRTLKRMALAGDNMAAEQLFLRSDNKKMDLRWLLLAGRRHDCESIMNIVNYYAYNHRPGSVKYWKVISNLERCPGRDSWE